MNDYLLTIVSSIITAIMGWLITSWKLNSDHKNEIDALNREHEHQMEKLSTEHEHKIELVEKEQNNSTQRFFMEAAFKTPEGKRILQEVLKTIPKNIFTESKQVYESLEKENLLK